MSTGKLVCVPDNPANPPVDIPVISGNNAATDDQKNPCRNNPKCASNQGHGPIPVGNWRWKSPTDPGGWSGKPHGRVLVPLDGTDTFGRDLFRTHSCSSPFGLGINKPFCSRGCVAGTVDDVKGLNKLLDAEPGSTLEVVP
jgi:hypothetical protein